MALEQITEQNNPLQDSLAANLGIQGFKNLPLHEDLKLFEELKFPMTPFGNALALAFVLKTT